MFRFLIALSLLIPNFGYAYECNEEIDKISAENNVGIFCKKSSVEAREDFEFEEADEEMILKATPAIKKFFSSYNKSFLNSLESLMLFKNINYLKSGVAGLHHDKTIWLCLENVPQERANRLYLKVLHHEFSSGVYDQISYYKKLIWKKINYAYKYTVAFLKKCLNDPNFSNATSDKLLSEGFLINYSLTDDENDFNVYAEMLFTDPEKLKNLKMSHQLIKVKLEKVKEFYRDAGFKGKFPDET